MKRVLVLPGAFQYVKNYSGYEGLDIWLKSSPAKIPVADYYVGHSAGASFILSHYDSIRSARFILINPLIRKRNVAIVIWSWITFLMFEGIKQENKLIRLVPISGWPYAIRKVLKLLKVDTLDIIRRIPKENIVIIRGKRDYYFCDKKSAQIIRQNAIKLIEVGAGHDWNNKIAQTVEICIKN